MRKPNLDTFPNSCEQVNKLLESLDIPERMKPCGRRKTAFTGGTSERWLSNVVECAAREMTYRQWLSWYLEKSAYGSQLMFTRVMRTETKTYYTIVAWKTGRDIVGPTTDVIATVKKFHDLEAQFQPIPSLHRAA